MRITTHSTGSAPVRRVGDRRQLRYRGVIVTVRLRRGVKCAAGAGRPAGSWRSTTGAPSGGASGSRRDPVRLGCRDCGVHLDAVPRPDAGPPRARFCDPAGVEAPPSRRAWFCSVPCTRGFDLPNHPNLGYRLRTRAVCAERAGMGRFRFRRFVNVAGRPGGNNQHGRDL